MKKSVLVIIGAAVLFQCQARTISEAYGDLQKTPAAKGSLTITSTPDLQKLTAKWISGFTALNPDLKIGVGAGEQATDLAFESTANEKSSGQESKWKMVIGRDAVVPVTGEANPNLAEIAARGISAGEFAKILSNGTNRTWGQLLEGNQKEPVTIYLPSDESVRSAVAAFTGVQSGLVTATTVSNTEELVRALREDPNGIAFWRIADLTDAAGQNLQSGISLLPIDKNANGRLDYIEKIYANVNDLSRGIWIGKYPQALCRNIYAVASQKPTKDNQVAFLRYVLTDGQEILATSGYNSLVNSERLSKIDRLTGMLASQGTSEKVNIIQLIITIVAGLAILFAIVFFIIRYRRSNLPAGPEAGIRHLHAINPRNLTVPKGLFFDKTHTWAFMEKEGTLKIGIDDFLQHITGSISSIIMKKPGDQVKKGEPILTIVQHGKRLTISSPASGIIIADNSNLFSNPSLVNSSPYEEGWVYRMEPSNWLRENQFLFMAEKYAEWIKGEFARLRDFLANAIKPEDPQYACVILQDGGEIADQVLESLAPEVWEDFQSQFIDSSK